MKVLVGALFGVLALAACGGEERPVELTAGDACGDAFFWAATDSGDVAVTVRIDARDRPPNEPTTREFALPDPAVVVEVLEGRDLQANFCNDVLSTASEPRTRQGASAGEGTIRLGPTTPVDPDYSGFGCGGAPGDLELSGLEAEDGRTFAPIRVTSNSIGCISG
jgi:hypothetical protein